MPIVVSEDGDLLFFESVDDAERYLEATDVEDGRYTAYDGRGGLLRLTTTNVQRPALGGLLMSNSRRVRVEPHETGVQHVERLRMELLDFVRRLETRAEQNADSPPLADLLKLAIDRAGYTSCCQYVLGTE